MLKKEKIKKVLMSALALVLVGGISVAGTLAYLSASQSGDHAVVNTFVVGNLLDPKADPDPTNPENPDKPVDVPTNGLYLMENKAEFDMATGKYKLLANEYVLENTYDRAIPAMEIPKNPSLSVDIATGMKAYVFVKVIDNLTEIDLGEGETDKSLSYVIDTDVWKEVTVAGLAANEKVYCYTDNYIVGAEGYDLTLQQILKSVDAYPDYEEGASVLVSTEFTVENEEDPLGTLSFEAYVCQAEGFTSSAEAFEKLF